MVSVIMPTNMKVIPFLLMGYSKSGSAIKCIHAQNVDYWKLTFDKFD